jgi:hypothetical protein
VTPASAILAPTIVGIGDLGYIDTSNGYLDDLNDPGNNDEDPIDPSSDLSTDPDPTSDPTSVDPATPSDQSGNPAIDDKTIDDTSPEPSSDPRLIQPRRQIRVLFPPTVFQEITFIMTFRLT